jgi:thiamine transport system ATP-binding protein
LQTGWEANVIRFKDVVYDSQGFRLSASFSVAAGQFVAVLGPSGAGKSTLLNMIAGFDLPQQGAIEIAGRDVTTLPAAERPVSMVFQDNNCFAHLDAWSNVALGIAPSRKATAAQEQSIAAALDAVGMSHLARRLPGEMSGGERQRIAIARVLVRERPVLLLDEAFAALGPALRRDMLNLVKSLHEKRKLTTLMVTHQPEDAQLVASDVIFVDSGVANAPVKIAEFFGSAETRVREYLGAWSALPAGSAAAAAATTGRAAPTRTRRTAWRNRR